MPPKPKPKSANPTTPPTGGNALVTPEEARNLFRTRFSDYVYASPKVRKSQAQLIARTIGQLPPQEFKEVIAAINNAKKFGQTTINYGGVANIPITDIPIKEAYYFHNQLQGTSVTKESQGITGTSIEEAAQGLVHDLGSLVGIQSESDEKKRANQKEAAAKIMDVANDLDQKSEISQAELDSTLSKINSLQESFRKKYGQKAYDSLIKPQIAAFKKKQADWKNKLSKEKPKPATKEKPVKPAKVTKEQSQPKGAIEEEPQIKEKKISFPQKESAISAVSAPLTTAAAAGAAVGFVNDIKTRQAPQASKISEIPTAIKVPIVADAPQIGATTTEEFDKEFIKSAEQALASQNANIQPSTQETATGGESKTITVNQKTKAPTEQPAAQAVPIPSISGEIGAEMEIKPEPKTEADQPSNSAPATSASQVQQPKDSEAQPLAPAPALPAGMGIKGQIQVSAPSPAAKAANRTAGGARFKTPGVTAKISGSVQARQAARQSFGKGEAPQIGGTTSEEFDQGFLESAEQALASLVPKGSEAPPPRGLEAQPLRGLTVQPHTGAIRAPTSGRAPGPAPAGRVVKQFSGGAKRKTQPGLSAGGLPISPPRMSNLDQAMRLNAEQGRARTAAGLSGMNGDTQPQDVREQIMSTTGGVDYNILPGAYNPLESRAYFAEPHMPGSMSQGESAETIERGGGEMPSSEADRARMLKQQQQAQIQQMMVPPISLGLPAIAGAAASSQPLQKTTEPAAESEEELEALEVEEEDEEVSEIDEIQGQTDESQSAMNLASAQNRALQAAKAAQDAQQTMQAAQKAVKAGKTFFDLVKTGQVAASESIVPILTVLVQLHIQVINKYTFKIPLIPPSYIWEDIIIGCIDITLCLGCCAEIFFYASILVILLAPIAAGILIFGPNLDILTWGAKIVNMFNF